MSRRKLFLSLIPIFIIVGCGNTNKSTVAINQIEKTITKEKTNLGCGNNNTEECKDNRSSAKFILETLEKDLVDDESVGNDITSLRENLNLSLQEISKEESKKNKLKHSLMALVDEVENKGISRAKRLKNFVNNLDDSELGLSNSQKITSIKNELENLIEIESEEVKKRDVMRKLKNIIENVTEDRKSLVQTEKTLKKLVAIAEKKNGKSIKKFATAIVKDVADKKIRIIDENDKYFIIKVQSGDNLSILAKRYYNDRSKFKLIYEANRDKINSKYEIYPDTKLLIPKI